ncbi:hypothetical protein SCP_0805820 [Sparassis crispa]|uniref:PIPK domain-containing protein n=1 Tax=Sparassis crispa TaxID=139825 RepID=A0A401GV11_9APHY|nr:hypothetical protein SCP_0805820 [Sparassis crispa]GBE86058.1 hypothetical protein SCP_0805820 [Sparassis crispa]
MAFEKPLPDVPSRIPNLTTLTLVASAHLHKFIRNSLKEEGEFTGEREVWANALQDALHELGADISRGGWLTGIKRSRTARQKARQRRREQEKRECVERNSKRRIDERDAEKEQTNDLEPGCVRLASSETVKAFPRLHAGNNREAALSHLREAVSKPFPPSPKPPARHLLLTVDAFSSPTAVQEREFHVVRAGTACLFVNDVFTLPTDGDDTPGRVLYGLDEWEDAEDEDPVQIVGGTFRFRGTVSPVQHESLCKVLRLSIFMYLSLVLEQHVLFNSHVELNFPKPSFPTAATVPFPAGPKSPQEVKGRAKHDSTFTSGLWSFFSKKTEHLLTRAANVGPSLVRRGSLELPLMHKHAAPSLSTTSDDGVTPRQRHFSFMSTVPPQASGESGPPKQPEFTSIVKHIERCKDLLSTSPGLKFAVPSVLVSLAKKETADPTRKLTGDEKAALSSILGWEGKETLAQGMTGTPGFVRHQGLSVLYSQHIPLPLTVSAAPMLGSSGTSTSSALQTSARPGYCGTWRKWITYRYYGRDIGADEALGEKIIQMCIDAEDACDNPDCHFKRGDHDSRWIHGGVRIVAAVGRRGGSTGNFATGDETIQMWEACAICGKESRKEQMFDGTYLLSFAKYLELLIYSPTICAFRTPLCEHTTSQPASTDTISPMRLIILRKFSYKSRTVTFSQTTIEDTFELRVPRFQIVRHKIVEKAPEGADLIEQSRFELSGEDDRRTLRREIMNWWQGLSEHMDKLEENFFHDDDHPLHKALPRLPSSDDAYEFDDAHLATPKSHPRRLSSGAIPPITQSNQNASGSGNHTPSVHATAPAGSASNSVSSFSTGSSQSQGPDSIHLLSGLRHSFQRTEQALYLELSRTSSSALNDVRRSFLTAARGASRRLAAWEHKHSSHLPKGSALSGPPSLSEPEWWKTGCHAVPGGNIIVRENDWGSIIAFTLSSQDYLQELANMSAPGRLGVPVLPSTPADARPSFFSTGGASLKRLISGSVPQLDPDEEGVMWQEPEAYSAVISRKEHPKDPTSLMSLREVLRHSKGFADGQGSPSGSKFVAAFSNTKPDHPVPSSAYAKPEVELSMQGAEGNVSEMSEAVEAAGKILHDLETSTNLAASWHSSAATSDTTPVTTSSFLETNIRRGKSSSIISSDSQGTVGVVSSSSSATPPPVPPKGASSSAQDHPEKNMHPFTDHMQTVQTSLAMSLTNTLTNAMRLMLKSGDAPQPPPHPARHALLVVDSPAIDERPHIKYDWTIGKRLRFSCTVYYAKQFDALRRRCGIEDMFLRSLSRSENWAAEGGKSKSNFWKTTDDQFIIKTLVNAWNVADLQVLIDLGPSYFRYMDATASKPTVLAKLLGFFTVEIRNLESGTTQAKADLLVMENLFYDQNIVKTFDLKGIQGRKVKASASTGSKTLFDGEWIEGQRRALTLVHPHSKVVFQEAIKADCDFLARSNVMDYSLLVGINEERKQIACGLVDTIGSYTFAKTLEYKAKQGLSAGKEVTVVPPHEYQERFVSAMNDYFLACPEKWSRPLDDTKVPSGYQELPSVL